MVLISHVICLKVIKLFRISLPFCIVLAIFIFKEIVPFIHIIRLIYFWFSLLFLYFSLSCRYLLCCLYLVTLPFVIVLVHWLFDVLKDKTLIYSWILYKDNQNGANIEGSHEQIHVFMDKVYISNHNAYGCVYSHPHHHNARNTWIHIGRETVS